MQSFVPADQFIAEGKSRHQASFFQPEYGTEASAKENPFHSSKRHESFRKAAVFNPAQGPFCFFLYSRNGFHCMKQTMFFLRIFDVTVDQQSISLCMNIFHHDLKSITTPGF